MPIAANEHAPAPTPDSRPGIPAVVWILAALSLLLGGVAFSRYHLAEKVVAQAIAQAASRGATADVEGCVDEVMAFGATCAAMKTLCEATVPRVMNACLAAQDRKPYCNALGSRSGKTSFGYKECEARGVTRRTKTTCASAYRTIDAYCKHMVHGPGPKGELL